MKRSRVLALAALTALAALPTAAWAGGFEFPDNGTEALGRGGAFVAKADSPLALEYNVAGLARQRGTRVLIDSNLSFHTYEFTRLGVYPGNPGDMATPFAGQAFPKVSNSGGPFYAPFVGIATDFGKLDRWTFAVGAYGPSSYGHRSFPSQVLLANGMTAPAPSRYDLTDANLLIVYPTVAAAFRATRWLDVGVALHVVVGHFDLANVAIVDLGMAQCHTPEYPNCDARNHLLLDGFTAAASFGVMARPIPNLSLGFSLRTPVYLEASGQVDTPGPKVLPTTGDAGIGHVNSFKTSLPLVARLGGRWMFRGIDGFEHGDVEADIIYEGWGWVQNPGINLDIENIGPLSGFKTVLQHNYQDTIGVRVGGAFNLRMKQGVLTFRAGGFFDSAASKQKDTRLDFDTMPKWAGTFGLGYEIRGVRINLAYAYLWSPDRDVKNGDLQPLNGLNGTSKDARGNPFDAVNNGFYHAATQVLSFGIEVVWDRLLKKKRVVVYQ
jgi:long-subunit fatty acid transport protein